MKKSAYKNSQRAYPVKINIFKKKMPKTLGHYKKLFDRVLKIAHKMSRQELLIFWLSTSVGQVSEKEFNNIIDEMKKFSKEEIIDILDELSKKDGEKLVEQYKNYLQN